jgi:hypothetical protein
MISELPAFCNHSTAGWTFLKYSVHQIGVLSTKGSTKLPWQGMIWSNRLIQSTSYTAYWCSRTVSWPGTRARIDDTGMFACSLQHLFRPIIPTAAVRHAFILSAAWAPPVKRFQPGSPIWHRSQILARYSYLLGDTGQTGQLLQEGSNGVEEQENDM